MTTTCKTKRATAAVKSADTPSAEASRMPRKSERLVAMLQAPEGVSVEELSNTFGWLPHTARAALSGLRKKGLPVIRARHGSVTVYRIGV
jgi:predicted ArsR family transcriptional regulator